MYKYKGFDFKLSIDILCKNIEILGQGNNESKLSGKKTYRHSFSR